MHDQIIVSNLCIHGYHGVKEAEKSLGQKFYIDLACGIDRTGRGEDQMTTTVCYGELCDLVERVSSGQTFNLIESLAESLATSIFASFSMVQTVDLTIRKPNAPIRHNVDFVAVAIVRNRNG